MRVSDFNILRHLLPAFMSYLIVNMTLAIPGMIQEIIETEEGKLTDQKIVDILATKGVKLARRTVAKYRRELDILSSHHR